jgi:hypothetical protein
LDLERVIWPLHELGDPGARAFTMGASDWPLRGFDIQDGKCVSGPCEGAGLRPLPVSVQNGYVLLDEDVPLEEPADLGG